ncbi:MAG: ABC transporter substrate-binding protein [Methylomicrobium sp.]|nr:ABC transporter substrate-binding protein [Methylomicrobium sp.]
MTLIRLAWFTLFLSLNCSATEKTAIRLGLLSFGTVAWEIEAMKQAQSAETASYSVTIVPIANPEAGKIALQSDTVDIIVSDWVWVSRQRSAGSDLTFYPYSTTGGALVVPQDSAILTVPDLAGKRVGIAGGELDKNWLLLKALARHQHQLDLDKTVEKTFAAPPLINQQLLSKRVDAAMNYWNFAAELEVQGYRQLMDGRQIIKALGITESVPTLGYVFKETWAKAHKQSVSEFLSGTRQARNQLCTSDQAWQGIVALIPNQDEQVRSQLRNRYCAGNVSEWGPKEQQAAERIYQLLRTESNNRLTGGSEHLQPGTFWAAD